jgi:pimeloyl-ACP methyl ester carboxylesterase
MKKLTFPLIGLIVVAGTAVAQRTPSMQHEYATVNGMKLHYVRSGQGDLVLFMHGFPEFWYAWKEQIADLGRNYLAVAPDLRGFGLSQKPAAVEDYRAANVIEDIRALAARLNGGKPFVLVGHDWGGAIAWGFAMKYPELLTKLIIINAPHPMVFARELRENKAQQRASAYMLFFRSAQAEAALSANDYEPLIGFFGGLKAKGKFSLEDEKAYREAYRQPGALTGGLNYYRASRIGPPDPGSQDTLVTGIAPGDSTVAVPTLVIWGEKDDALLTGNLVGLEAFVPNLEIHRIQDGTHWVVHEVPEQISQLIRGFIARP